MLKQVKKWCVYENDTIIDAYSTKEQAQQVADKLQKEYMEWRQPCHEKRLNDRWCQNLYYHYSVGKSNVLIFVENERILRH